MKRKNLALRATSALLLSFVLAACSSSNNSPDEGDGNEVVAATFKSIQDDVFTPNCVMCHSATGPAAGMSLAEGNAYANLVGIGSSGKDGAVRVITNDPDNSYLIQKLEGAADIEGLRMPRNAEPLPAATIQSIRDWIAAGALDN